MNSSSGSHCRRGRKETLIFTRGSRLQYPWGLRSVPHLRTGFESPNVVSYNFKSESPNAVSYNGLFSLLRLVNVQACLLARALTEIQTSHALIFFPAFLANIIKVTRWSIGRCRSSITRRVGCQIYFTAGFES